MLISWTSNDCWLSIEHILTTVTVLVEELTVKQCHYELQHLPKILLYDVPVQYDSISTATA